jgi:hypothetical protein
MNLTRTFAVLALFIAPMNLCRAADPPPATAAQVATQNGMESRLQAAPAAARARMEGTQNREPQIIKAQAQLLPSPNSQEKPGLSSAPLPHVQTEEEKLRQRRYLLTLIAGLLAVGAICYLARRQRSPAGL